MADFHVTISDSNSIGVHADQHLDMRPMRWSSRAKGGYYRARVQVTGSGDAFESLPRHLGNDIAIHSELGQEVWSGYIHEIEIIDGGQRVTFSLDNVVNRVAVAYTTTLADGSEQRQTTDWVQDARSIERYGKRAELVSTSATSESAAEALRDMLLAQYAKPEPQYDADPSESSGVEAMLYCYGKAERLKNVLYSNAEGLEENAESRRGEIALGAHYTASTISFAAQDDIHDSASGLSALTEGESFYVDGSSLNDGSYTVASYDNATHIEVSTKSILDEAAGAAITLARDEDASTRLAQSFQAASAPWDAYSISLRVRKVGAPSDNLQARLYTNNGGVPGTLLAYGNVAPADVPTDDAWVLIDMDTPVTLAAGTTYFIDIIRQTRAESLGGYYVISLDENLQYTSGSLLSEKDGAWTTRTVDADLLFRITSREDTVDQMVAILADGNLFDVVVPSVSASNIDTWQYRSGDRTAWDELEELLDIGDSTGEPLLFAVTSGNVARIYAKPDTAITDAILGSDGHMKGVDPGQLVAGQWVGVGNQLMATMLGEKKVFVAECEYNGESNSISIKTETAPDIGYAV